MVLVVEDEAEVQRFAVDALGELGYTTLTAASADDAVAALASDRRITLLFTDVVMPDMNGQRLAELALRDRPDLKVLYTTGYARDAVVHDGMLDVGVALLLKPYTIAELARKVRDVIDGGGVNRPS